MIGNERDARMAALGMLRHIGSGWTRDAYVADNVVYKVETEDVDTFNRNEHIRADKWRNQLPEGFAIPKSHLWEVDGLDILAMEYIDGEPTGECFGRLMRRGCDDGGTCIPEDLMNVLDNISHDLRSWGNVIRGNDGVHYLIDLGS